uniref:Uncharacterized protein n=1 Tax=Romanomermis culicivorax TaxID=13658 RepID=A0A915KR62_ROMCU
MFDIMNGPSNTHPGSTVIMIGELLVPDQRKIESLSQHLFPKLTALPQMWKEGRGKTAAMAKNL